MLFSQLNGLRVQRLFFSKSDMWFVLENVVLILDLSLQGLSLTSIHLIVSFFMLLQSVIG
ncbi:hypothetical protein J11TS1_36020 [Oceanobacillus sp. J11TS1]|nr:hypothetical protein J11TS1_36020 [Oceanobacillus sp. J11TS1]